MHEKQKIINDVIEGYSADYSCFSIPVMTSNILGVATYLSAEHLLPQRFVKYLDAYKNSIMQEKIKKKVLDECYNLASKLTGKTSFSINSESEESNIINQCFSKSLEKLSSEEQKVLKKKYTYPFFAHECI